MFNDISLFSKICLIISMLIMGVFFVIQSLVVFGVMLPSIGISYFGYACIILFMPLFGRVVYEFLNDKNDVEEELVKKNTYLEHAAKILRHDMHSGINVYMPRGLSSLERRLGDKVSELKIDAPMRMIKEGLRHTQKVYRGVFEFTNLVKKDSILSKEESNIKEILEDYLSATSYKSQVFLNDNLPTIDVNQSLFCTAVDNLIRNGLKYNDSSSKLVRIYLEDSYICVEDNGRGLSKEEFEDMSKPYTRKKEQKESGSGLGLNICSSIMVEHGFDIGVSKIIRGSEDFFTDLDRIEKKIGKNTKRNIFNKEELMRSAKDNNYKGKLITKRGRMKNDKVFVIYKNGVSGGGDYAMGTKFKIKIK